MLQLFLTYFRSKVAGSIFYRFFKVASVIEAITVKLLKICLSMNTLFLNSGLSKIKVFNYYL